MLSYLCKLILICNCACNYVSTRFDDIFGFVPEIKKFCRLYRINHTFILFNRILNDENNSNCQLQFFYLLNFANEHFQSNADTLCILRHYI